MSIAFLTIIYEWIEIFELSRGLNFRLLAGRSSSSSFSLFLFIYLFILNFFDYYYHYKRLCVVASFCAHSFRIQICVFDHMRMNRESRNDCLYTLFKVLSAKLAPLHFSLFVQFAFVCVCVSIALRIHMNENDERNKRLINQTHDKPEI